MDIRENLKAYVDGELSPNDAQAVEAAIAKDPILSAEVEQIRAIGRSVFALRPDYHPVGMDDLLAKVARPVTSRRQPWFWPVLTTTALAAAFFGFTILTNRHDAGLGEASKSMVAMQSDAMRPEAPGVMAEKSIAPPVAATAPVTAPATDQNRVNEAAKAVAPSVGTDSAAKAPSTNKQPGAKPNSPVPPEADTKATSSKVDQALGSMKATLDANADDTARTGKVDDPVYTITAAEMSKLRDLATKVGAKIESHGDSAAEIVVDDAEFAKLKTEIAALPSQTPVASLGGTTAISARAAAPATSTETAVAARPLAKKSPASPVAQESHEMKLAAPKGAMSVNTKPTLKRRIRLIIRPAAHQ